MDHSIKYTLTRGEEEIELDIEYSLAPFYPGNTFGPPEHCEPPSGGDVEDWEISRDGEPFALTQEEEAKLEQHIYETHDYDGDTAGYYED